MFLLLSTAHAFCGAYVGAPGANLTNYSSEVVLAREGDRTTLTLVSDYAGDATEFALLLPVPMVLGPDDVGVIDPVLLDWIDAYSTPREVEYTCDTAFAASPAMLGCGGVMGCGGSYSMYDTATDVESSWSAHGYDFVVLSAEESSGLLGWLEINGYAVPEGGEAVLQEYIDAGSFFLAARVTLDPVAARDGDWLWPIQVSYRADVFSLPIRIGTISSEGEQEVVIYTLTDPVAGGEVGIANYPRLEIPTECMLPPATTMMDWYGARLTDAHAEGGAGWVREYSWELVPEVQGGYHCDPCTAEPVAPGGSFEPFGRNSDSAHLTRLRMRYTPAQATEDLQLYVSGITGVKEQLKIIRRNPELEELFPYCDTGWAEDPGTCPDAPLVRSARAPSPQASAFALLAVLAMLRRRRA